MIQRVPLRGPSWEESDPKENNAWLSFSSERVTLLTPPSSPPVPQEAQPTRVWYHLCVLKCESQSVGLSWSWVDRARKSCMSLSPPAPNGRSVLAKSMWWTPVDQGAHNSAGDSDECCKSGVYLAHPQGSGAFVKRMKRPLSLGTQTV